MGFLDDAIREHLDLKRRRGGDPTEIERAEREALGPVRRDPLDDGQDEPEAAISGDVPAGAYDHAAEPAYEEEYEADGEDWGDAFEHESSVPEAGAEPVADEHDALSEEPLPEEEPFAEESFTEESPPRARHPADVGAGDETEEYDVEG